MRIKKGHFIRLLVGITLGLVLSSHAIRSVLHIDFHKAAIFLFLIVIIINFSVFLFSAPITLTFQHYVFMMFFLMLLLYAFFTAYLNKNGFILLEFLSVILPLSLGASLGGKNYEIKIARNIVLFSCLIQSLYLLYDPFHVLRWKLNYLLVGSLLPVAIIFSFDSVWRTKDLKHKAFYLISFAIMILAMAKIQARYSMLAALVGIIVIMLINYRAILSTWTGRLFLVLIISQVDRIWEFIRRAQFFARMLEFDLMSFDRIQIIGIYWNLVKPLWLTGFGIGDTPKIPIHYYPHNYALELFTELGIMGLLFAILLTLLAVFTACLNNSGHQNDRFVIILLFYYILFFLKSATIYDAYVLFTCFGLALSRRSLNLKTILTSQIK